MLPPLKYHKIFHSVSSSCWLESLQISWFQVNKRCRFLLDFDKVVKYELENLKLQDHPFDGQTVDASSLGWAMSAVSSRAFRLYGNMCPDGTHADVPMMLPLIDMCNHSFNPNAKIVQQQEATSRRMLVKAC